MVKKINKYINVSIATSILFALLGIIILLFPKTTLNIFSYATAIILIMTGIYLLILDIRTRNNLFYMESSFFGILLLVLGFIIIVHPSAFTVLIPLVLGIWFITSSVLKFRFSTFLRRDNFGLWVLTLLITILSIVCGVIFILNPIESSKIITSYFGLIMVIYSIADVVDMIIFKMNMKKISKYLKENAALIDQYI